MGIFSTSPKLLLEDIEEQLDVSEKVDPVAERLSELEDVDCCSVTAYVGGVNGAACWVKTSVNGWKGAS